MTGYNPIILGDFSELFPKNSGRLVRDMTYQWSQAGDFNHWQAMSLLGWLVSPPCRCRFRGAAFSIFVVERNHGHFFDPCQRWGRLKRAHQFSLSIEMGIGFWHGRICEQCVFRPRVARQHMFWKTSAMEVWYQWHIVVGSTPQPVANEGL